MSESKIIVRIHATDVEGIPVIRVHLKEVSFVLVRLVEKNDMYRKGLQKDWKNLVYMPDVTMSLAILLQSHHDIGNLTENVYNTIIELYEKFIYKSMSYEKFMQWYEQANAGLMGLD